MQEIIKTITTKIATAQSASKFCQKSVRLVAVSKTKSSEMIKEVYDLGQRHFGENYVDEIEKKSPELPDDIKWHFIGHLQSNKINKVLVPNLYCLETLDSVKLAKKLEKSCDAKDRELNVMIQVSTSDETTKNGADAKETQEIAEYVLKECKRLKFMGLMTIGQAGDSGAFEKLRSTKQSIVDKFGLDHNEVELSMGMTGDFEEAVLEGSTNVRIGSMIFGARAPRTD